MPFQTQNPGVTLVTRKVEKWLGSVLNKPYM